MSAKTGDTIEATRNATNSAARMLLGSLRRMAVRVSSKPFWQSVGVLLLDNKTKETVEAEVFSGIGFYSRPKAGANAETLIGYFGDTSNPVVIATRDEGLRSDMAKLDEDETAIYNSKVSATATADGHFEIQSGPIGGAPERLPTWADIQALAARLEAVVVAHNTHTHAVVGTTAIITTSLVAGPAPTLIGTTVLKAE